MSEIKKDTDLNKTVKKKRKLSKPAIFLIVGIIIIVVPCLIFGGILLSSAMNTGTPIFGDRYEGDLDPAITDEDISALETDIRALSGVENLDITLISGQLRINIDTTDALTAEEINALVKEVYTAVDNRTAIATYFTSTEDKKMYDLAINAYNYIDSENEGMIYYILTKNAMMEEYDIQLVSEPLDEELASDLRGDTEPTTSPSSQNVIE